MFLDFNGYLAIAAIITGSILLIYWLRQRRHGLSITPGQSDWSDRWWVKGSRYFFPILMAVLVLRVGLYETFRIPSGSMKPTLYEGEFILVNKYTYGVRLPLIGTQILPGKKPERGDVIVFRYPVDTDINFIKRVVGLPGDSIRYEDKTLYVNNEPQSIEFSNRDFDNDLLSGQRYRVQAGTEALGEHPHPVWVREQAGPDLEEVVVPEGHFFVLGDNRDNSGDSRVFGFVSDRLMIGKAVVIWMSWNSGHRDVRWDRIGMLIK